MQFVQIGQVPGKTLLQLIEEMAAIQFAEIERLKQSALVRQAVSEARSHRGGRSPIRRRSAGAANAA
jgi:hypothetical protein